MKEVLIDNGKESGIIYLLYDYSGKGEDGNWRSYSAKLHYIHDIETNRSFYIVEVFILVSVPYMIFILLWRKMIIF